jgi:hypothetical protein
VALVALLILASWKMSQRRDVARPLLEVEIELPLDAPWAMW